jgi:hypothetical protein
VVEFLDDAVDTAALSRIVAAQRLASALDGPVSPDHRSQIWAQVDGLLSKDSSDDVAATLAFGLRRTYDIPYDVLKKLSSKAQSATAVLFEEGEGISDADWTALCAASPQSMASAMVYRQRLVARKNQDQTRMDPPAAHRDVLGAGYPTLKAALSELHQTHRLTNELLTEIAPIWGLPCLVGTIALRCGLTEDKVLLAMRQQETRAQLFSSANIDSALVATLRTSLTVERPSKIA